MKLITKTTLKKWNACEEGYNRFNELFPKGATLQNASKGLIKDKHQSWSDWLWKKCKHDADYCEQTSITAGDSGTATAGDSGTATAGYRGTATVGDSGTATAGNFGTATAGYRGTATVGDSGTATAGDSGTATAGDRGTATAGNFGTATAGYRGTATVGDSGTATAGDSGTATAGDSGVICLLWWNGNLYLRKAAEVDGVKIKANTPYKLDDKGKFVKATNEKEA